MLNFRRASNFCCLNCYFNFFALLIDSFFDFELFHWNRLPIGASTSLRDSFCTKIAAMCNDHGILDELFNKLETKKSILDLQITLCDGSQS